MSQPKAIGKIDFRDHPKYFTLECQFDQCEYKGETWNKYCEHIMEEHKTIIAANQVNYLL